MDGHKKTKTIWEGYLCIQSLLTLEYTVIREVIRSMRVK